MARIDDVIYSYMHLERIEAQDAPTKAHIQEAIRYGFQQGESFGKYARYAEEVQEQIEIAREDFQKPKTKKIQKVVRTEKGYKPTELDSYLNDGWHVAHITPMADGRLEYIIETEVIDETREKTGANE